MIELREGDHIASEGVSEEKYHKVAKKFIAAGRDLGEYPSYDTFKRWPYFGIHCGALYHGHISFDSPKERLLTIADLLGSEEEEYVPKVGEECEEYYSTDTHPSWEKCKIMAISEFGMAINFYSLHEIEWRDKTNLPKFRKIKSEREKCVEEIIEIITRGKTVNNGYRSIAECIYDSGWRKV